MTGKRGTTLIEAIIAIAVVSIAIVTLLEALNVSITETLDLSRKTSALNLAKSELEYVKSQTYNVSTGNISNVYGVITTGSNISDKVNYNISGQVNNVNINQSLQQITVNVSYLHGKQVQLTGYKLVDGTEPASRGLLVSDDIENVPTLPQGYSLLCLGQYKGYYHVFTTGTTGPASASWKFYWYRVSSSWDLGAPMMAIYNGTPSWVQTDSNGNAIDDGIVMRNQNQGFLNIIGIGDLPGPGDASVCDCCTGGGNGGPGDDSYCSNESNPIAWTPHNHVDFWYPLSWFYGGQYPCSGGSYDGGEIYWTYDSSGSSGYVDNTLVTTGNLSPGTYTVLFFNGENEINLDTISASVAYWK